MTTTTMTIKLGQIADEAGDYVDEAPALDPADAREPQIVEVSPSGTLSIVDGFHRTAGQVRWCRENGVAVEDCEITVVACDDAALIRDAAEPGPKQQAAIEAIYAAAGL